MVAVPVPRTWYDKEIPPYSTVNDEIYDVVRWMLEPPMCKVRQTVAQSIPNATWTAVKFETEDVDSYNWHNPTTSTRVTPNIPGWYRGWYSVSFAGSNVGNFRTAYVTKSGTVGRARRDQRPTTASSSPVGSFLRGIPFYMPMNGTTDYLEVMCFQDSGGSLNISLASTPQFANAELFLRWVAPL